MLARCFLHAQVLDRPGERADDMALCAAEPREVAAEIVEHETQTVENLD